jgi:hypothetical protein
LNVLYSGYRSNTQTTDHHKCYILLLSTSSILIPFQPSIIAYNNIPKETNKAPSRPVPPTATLLTAPLDFEADAALEVELDAPVGPPALVLVVVTVLFGKMPDGVEAADDVLFLGDAVVVEAGVEIWLTCIVTVVLAEVVVLPPELSVERPLMLKYVEYWKVVVSESSWSLRP